MNRILQNNKTIVDQSTKINAFSLVETLLYISIFSVVVFMMLSIYGVVMDSRVNARVVSEVTSEGSRIMQIITQTARNATLINSPTAGNNATTLSLNVVNVANNPTMFYMVGNDIVMKEGASSAIILIELKFLGLNLQILPGVEQRAQSRLNLQFLEQVQI
jgi:hypothetical protein